MTKLYNHSVLKERRKNLRSDSTEEEVILWSILKKFLKDARFRRQYSIGNFIIDFYSTRYRIAIEIDGEYHDNQKEYDEERENFIKSKNITLIRFKNIEIKKDLRNVIDKIKKLIFVCKM
jgi:very-short-patch-repair endonuclease